VGFTTGSRGEVPGKKENLWLEIIIIIRRRKPVTRNYDDDDDDDNNNNNNNNNNNINNNSILSFNVLTQPLLEPIIIK
jgi:hypothetical protein